MEERGSVWRKWDFHVHTPYSILNNGYGFNPYKPNTDEQFDNFVKTLFEKAVENEIAAIGITDYFSVEGYKRIRENYLSNDSKMAELFPDEDFRNKIKSILVFPNIEFRLDSFVGEKSHAVNYHVLFPDTISASDIESNFLSQLSLVYGGEGTFPLCRDSVERIGRDYRKHNKSESGSDYLVGLNRITVNYNQVVNVLMKSAQLRDKYLITAPVDDDLSAVNWNGRDYPTRKNIYFQCNLLLTSNEKTRLWALAKGHEADQIAEFGSIKPCIWGSDAHSYDRLFRPSEDRFCWIKADVSFDGLMQVIYEPEDRVRIQKDRPEEKDAHQIIDRVSFEDEAFQEEPIYLSEGLTAIIGGKSTGKSILLRHIAKSIDPKQVEEREMTSSLRNSKLDVKAKVIWKDGVSGERRIIYIPQSWLNRIVDESEGESQLNTMLQDILVQQADISKAQEILKAQITRCTEEVKHSILDYVSAYERMNEAEKRLLNFGRSEAFISSIDKLEKQRQELSDDAGITDDTLKKYSEVGKELSELHECINAIEREDLMLESIDSPYTYLPGISTVLADGSVSYNYDCLPISRESITATIAQMNETLRSIWESASDSMRQLIDSKKDQSLERLSRCQDDYMSLQEEVTRNDQLIKIDKQLQEEKEKLKKSKAYELEKESAMSKMDGLKTEILSSRSALKLAYANYANQVSALNSSDSDLEFEADVQIKEKDLFDAISNLFNNKTFRAFKEKSGYGINDKDDFKYNEGLLDALWNAMLDNTLSFKGGNTLQSALEHLFSDWFFVHYTIKSGNDTISSMSPGKKALVLLEMIVNLEKSNCPILIDQPEDDLDNRSIYTDLVSYLKTKKRERQIIVVTHNANVVVGADAEEVVIANQDGKGCHNNSKRFEYRCGAIENVSPVTSSDGSIISGILNQKGIQEQICDILEGGKDAFELRKKKYIGV